MEFMGGGDLACAIKLAKKENRTFPERVIWCYFIQILRGLVSLNQFKIIHRDIKPANIFLNGDMKAVKLGDMNVSKVVENDLTRTQIGTPSYLSPEIWENKAYDARCDIYSLGCCMYEMAALRLPFEARSMDELKQKIRNNMISPLPGTYSEELKKTIFKCLAKNPTARPNAEKLLSLPIIQLKISEYDLGAHVRDEEAKLMDTILVPNKISNLKNVLPKKSTAKRSSSMANLKINESKVDNFSSNTSKKEISTGQVKTDTKSGPSTKTDLDKVESIKKLLLPPTKPSSSSPNQKPIDVSKANMNKVNSKHEIQVEVIDNQNKFPIPQDPKQGSSRNNPIPVIPEKQQSSRNNLVPLPSDKKISSKRDPIESFERLMSSDKKKASSGYDSQRDVISKGEVVKRPSSKNIPPSPPTKIEAIKNNQITPITPQSNQGEIRNNSRNSSLSARKCEPVIEARGNSIKRQSSASKLSSNKNIKDPQVKLEQVDSKNMGKLPLKQPEKPLPPSSNQFKKPPMKSLMVPQRNQPNESSKMGRYSTNPNNNSRQGESREKVMKFDDFIKNFEGSANRGSKLRLQRDEEVKDGKGQRYSSVRQKTRN